MVLCDNKRCRFKDPPFELHREDGLMDIAKILPCATTNSRIAIDELSHQTNTFDDALLNKFALVNSEIAAIPVQANSFHEHGGS